MRLPLLQPPPWPVLSTSFSLHLVSHRGPHGIRGRHASLGPDLLWTPARRVIPSHAPAASQQ